MKIYLTDQSGNFDKLLLQLISSRTTHFDKSKLKEKSTAIGINTNKKLGELNLGFFFDYKIFPSNILTYLTQWRNEKRKMQVGDTVLQQVCIPPIKTFSKKIVFGVRINNIIDEVGRKGFSYVTLEGHVEKGESIFTIESIEGGLIFRIRTFSAHGNLLTRLVGRVFTVPYQAYCTRKALENVKRQIEE